MRGRPLMVQGTASSAGKSLLVTALCRILHRRGVRVAPFKAQNMSNNSFVDASGRELGRAQAEQAAAAGIAPTAEMNPILLKPEADHRSQVVVLGRPQGVIRGADFIRRKQSLWPVVTEALDSLLRQYEAVIIEGAGSPAEINLRAGDIVNMRVARYAEAPVLLAGDIDRGGVFAHLVGTLQLLEPEERRLVRGLVINKFRGSLELLQPGIDWLQSYTGIPVAGVVPWLDRPGIAEEDAVALQNQAPAETGVIDVAAVRLPHVANFDDLDALAGEAGVAVRWIASAQELGRPSLVVLPGTKSTIADLGWLRRVGLDTALVNYAEGGGAIVGICGGYQMLGRRIVDHTHVESDQTEVPGLSLLEVETMFEPAKATNQVVAEVTDRRGLLRHACEPLYGYEIHMGRTQSQSPALRLHGEGRDAAWRADGVLSPSGNIFGTYVHGLFDDVGFRRAVLATLGHLAGSSEALMTQRERAYERLADHVEAALDMRLVLQLLGLE